MNRYDPFRTTGFAAADWEKPWACGGDGGNCVEVNMSPSGSVGVRDSKLPDSPVLVFSSAEWKDFLCSARAGQYDV
jgi:hypothetical protein